MKEQPACFEVTDDVAVAVLDPASFVIGRFFSEFAIGSDGADQMRALAIDKAGLLISEDLIVNFAKRGAM